MVRLRNITKLKTGTSADYYPEGKEAYGHIVLDEENNIVIKELAQTDKYGAYLMKAHVALVQLLESGKDLPSETTLMWY